MNTREHMSEKIRQLRQKKNISQADLGKMLSNPKRGGTVSSWETGRTLPDEDDLLDLCEIFGVEISYFYPGRKDDNELTDEEIELLAYFRKLPDRAKHALLIGLCDFTS